MPRVRSSLIVSLVKSYYDYVKNTNSIFRIGLNRDSLGLLSGVPCSGTEVPGCVDATYEWQFMTGAFTAKFLAMFTPSSNATLNNLSLAALRPNMTWFYETGLIDMGGFSIQLTGGTQYSVSLEDKITYPMTI